MLLSLALIFLIGMILGSIFEMIKLPRLMGMLIAGIILGPYALNFLDASILSISPELRKIALIIILTRAGLNLDIDALKKVGRPAILMCFVPASIEILAVVLLGPKLFNISVLDAAIMGCVVAAVSPAVIVPKMLKLMELGYGKKNSIPQLIMASASIDDVFVIVLFTSLLGLAQGGEISSMQFFEVPISIITGSFIGFLFGYLLAKFFEKVHLRDSGKVVIFISISFLFVSAEDFHLPIAYSGLIAVMALGIALKKYRPSVSIRLSKKYAKIWVPSEILLFVLVGATVNISYALNAGMLAIVLIVAALFFRMLGVFLCLIKTKLSKYERFFCMVSYSPKATVQAAIGSIPLTAGLASGELILTVAVLAILITAPLGAFSIDLMYKRLPNR